MIRKFHPDKIPILLNRNRNSKLKQFDNNKYSSLNAQDPDFEIVHGVQAHHGDKEKIEKLEAKI